MPKAHLQPKIVVEFPEPEVFLCEVCGQEYHEWQMVSDSRLMPMCFGCSYPKRRLQIAGLNNLWMYEFDNGVCDTTRLICRQVLQIAAAIQRLEDECKMSL